MKKAAIITIVDKDNYGNRLQNYAVQETLKKHKLDVTTINNTPILNSGDKYILRKIKYLLLKLKSKNTLNKEVHHIQYRKRKKIILKERTY